MEDVIEALKSRYGNLHPLIFHRSVERTKTHGELFDLLEMFPKEYPVVWDEGLKRWVTTDDIFQSESFSKK